MVSEIRQAILPLALRRLKRGDDLVRAALLIESLGRYWCDRKPFELLIVSPGRDTDLLQRSLPSLPQISVTVRSESDFFPTLSPFYLMSGWYRQQILKLHVPAKLGFGGYMTLDSDVVCVGEFDSTTFVRDGRVFSQWEWKNKHEWWKRISKVVGIAYDGNSLGLSVTPNILHGHLARQALEHVANGNDDPTTALYLWSARNVGAIAWTEYSLYTSVADLKGNLFKFHLTCDECYTTDVHLYSARSCIWAVDDFERLVTLPYGNDPGGTFIVVQSHARIPIERVREYCFSFGGVDRAGPASGQRLPKRRTPIDVPFNRPALPNGLEHRIVASLGIGEQPEAPPAGWRRLYLAVVRERFTNSDGLSRQTVIETTPIASVVWLAFDPDNEDTEAVRIYVDLGQGDARQLGYLPRRHGIRPNVAMGTVAAWFAHKERDVSGFWTAEIYILIKET